jgi:hypothetical protein
LDSGSMGRRRRARGEERSGGEREMEQVGARGEEGAGEGRRVVEFKSATCWLIAGSYDP